MPDRNEVVATVECVSTVKRSRQPRNWNAVINSIGQYLTKHETVVARPESASAAALIQATHPN
jgi:hypothetical protein